MSLKISNEETFSKGINRLINEELTAAYDSLVRMQPQKHHEVIHAVRKSLKKLRAVLRLVREPIGEENYKYHNHLYRNLGREISTIRDSTSIINVIEDLKHQYASELENDTFKTPVQSLKYYRKQLTSRHINKEKRLDNIHQALSENLKQDRLELPKKMKFKDIAPGLRRVYKRGKEAMAKAAENNTTENLHDWRKRVKYLRYQVSIISRIWPNVLKAYNKELHTLSDLLGTDHDLAILTSTLEEQTIKFKDDAEKVLLLALINHQRNTLQQHAFLIGAKLYFYKSDDFLEWLSACWKNNYKKTKQVNLPKLNSLKY